MSVKFRTCKLFQKTFANYKNNKQVVNKFKEFVARKEQNPDEGFGSKDYSFGRKGNLSGYYHAGLTFDVSLIYNREGDTINLFGLFSHDESGTGQPANINKQQSLKTKLDNQDLSGSL